MLYPATLRSLLMDLALLRTYSAQWSDEIQGEWIRNLLEHRPDLDAARLERTRRLMERALPLARVDIREALRQTPVLPDPADRHVLAAALACEASFIVTRNLKDFPPAVLGACGVEAIHPDTFLLGLLAAHPAEVEEALQRQLARSSHPPLTRQRLLERLATQGAETFAEQLKKED